MTAAKCAAWAAMNYSIAGQVIFAGVTSSGPIVTTDNDLFTRRHLAKTWLGCFCYRFSAMTLLATVSFERAEKASENAYACCDRQPCRVGFQPKFAAVFGGAAVERAVCAM